ncbi:uncharacterized protein BDZ99DRAFT_189889 [Mytilinidion resinicola]|uniref:F-box domain-containing protein n=1 Tax=Mytilinidion resinicola TaxID=574789 RepID=A0A6A6Z307_9PEZI|nr:uncharacterized protein BDZ99DRAFT_189889 [Mytilinidion resinicola]KAF2815063.1 hypothetical protein BDZ99DRAFT_189889 [Mytilinidion resinicola]
MTSATSRVLSTTELLEHILLHLPPPSLLFAQRICTTWRSLIQRSLPLQRALFLAPTAQPLLVSSDPPYTLPPVNPFLKSAFAGHIDRHSKPMRWVTAQGEHCIVFVVRVVSAEWPDAFKYPEASWRQMLLTQPPVKAASVMDFSGVGLAVGPRRGVAHFEARNEEGVRMMEVVYAR